MTTQSLICYWLLSTDHQHLCSYSCWTTCNITIYFLSMLVSRLPTCMFFQLLEKDRWWFGFFWFAILCHRADGWMFVPAHLRGRAIFTGVCDLYAGGRRFASLSFCTRIPSHVGCQNRNDSTLRKPRGTSPDQPPQKPASQNSSKSWCGGHICFFK